MININIIVDYYDTINIFGSQVLINKARMNWDSDSFILKIKDENKDKTIYNILKPVFDEMYIYKIYDKTQKREIDYKVDSFDINKIYYITPYHLNNYLDEFDLKDGSSIIYHNKLLNLS